MVDRFFSYPRCQWQRQYRIVFRYSKRTQETATDARRTRKYFSV